MVNFTDSKMKILASLLFCAVMILPKINGKKTENFTSSFIFLIFRLIVRLTMQSVHRYNKNYHAIWAQQKC